MNRLFRLFLTLSFALLVGSACAPAVSDDARITAFEVTPAALPRGGGDVEARWKVEAARKVVLEIDGEQREVEPEGSLSIPIADTTKVVLYAHGKVGGDRKDVVVSVEHITVSGAVVDPTGAAVEGIEVRVNGGEAVLTDGNGHFATSDVAVPYSIHLRAPAGEGRQDQLWLGLRTPDVTVSVPQKYSKRPPPRRRW